MKPSTLAVNCSPTVMALPSPESGIGGVAELDSNEHGHAAAPEVVKDDVTGGFVNVGWPHHVRFGWLHPWARLV